MLDNSDIRAIGRFLKKKRIEKGLSARELANRVGISDAHIIYIEKAQRKATFEKIMNILNALGVSPDEMFREIGKSLHRIEEEKISFLRRIPVVTWVTAGNWRQVCDSFEPGDADEWIDSDERGENIFALQVTGNSMEPEFRDGEIIIINPHLEAQPNDYVVVKNKDGEATFKQLKVYGTRWVLHPLNPAYQDIETEVGNLKVIGRVVKKEKRY